MDSPPYASLEKKEKIAWLIFVDQTLFPLLLLLVPTQHQYDVDAYGTGEFKSFLLLEQFMEFAFADYARQVGGAIWVNVFKNLDWNLNLQ